MESSKHSLRPEIDVLAVLRSGRPFCFEWWISFGLNTHLAANQRMVGVTVSAVSTEDSVERGSSADNEVQLVSMTGSGVNRFWRRRMFWLWLWSL